MIVVICLVSMLLTVVFGVLEHERLAGVSLVILLACLFYIGAKRERVKVDCESEPDTLAIMDRVGMAEDNTAVRLEAIDERLGRIQEKLDKMEMTVKLLASQLCPEALDD